MGPRPVMTGFAAAAMAVMSACAPTARTAGPYEAKAVKASESVHSAVASDLLVLDAVRRHHTTAPYVSVATSQAEDDGSSAASSFRSIQPPDQRSEDVRDELSDLLDKAESALGDARVAGRRGDVNSLLHTAGELQAVAERLEQFQQAHQ